MEPAVASSIRAFIALDLSETARGQIDELVRDLKKSDAPVGWVRVEGIHLTLKFLGGVSTDLIERIKPVLSEIATGTGPIHIEPAGCGAFPTIRQPRVVWVGFRGQSAPLSGLQRQVEEAMVPFGFEPEKRPFKPHLTVGRVKGRHGLLALQQILFAHLDFAAEPFDVAELVLYKSELRPEGARYTPLFKAPLAGRPA